MSGKPRKPRDYRRARPSRRSKPLILIVCGCKETEYNYFFGLCRKLRLNSIKVIPTGSDNAPVKVVRTAIRKREEAANNEIRDGYDSVWCVMDVECPADSNLPQAMTEARAKNILLALTNPCFEYWYLLHYEKTGRLFNSCKEVIKRLKHHYPKYKKSNSGIVKAAFDLSDAAFKNANELARENDWGNDLLKCNPSTNVFKIVEDLRRISRGEKPIYSKI